MVASNHAKQTVYDSSGNKFKVTGFTKSLEGAVNGFYLQGERGAKEVGLSEYKFFSSRKPRRKR
jgi:hypothetical protein